MKCNQLLKNLNQIMPISLAMGFDNVGLLVGHQEKEIKKILLALDATSEVIEEGIQKKVDLILTHHPLIFSAIKQITDADIVGKRLLKLIENQMGYIAMHTNYDIALNCMAEVCAEILEILGEPLEVTGEIEGISVGIGKVGNLKEEMHLQDLVEKIKKGFGLDFVRVYGANLVQDKEIRRIAISPGSGRGMYPYAVEKRAEVLITGDITHHEGIDAKEAGICIIDAGHYGIEQVFIKDMEIKLKKIDHNLEIIKFHRDIPDIIL